MVRPLQCQLITYILMNTRVASSLTLIMRDPVHVARKNRATQDSCRFMTGAMILYASLCLALRAAFYHQYQAVLGLSIKG